MFCKQNRSDACNLDMNFLAKHSNQNKNLIDTHTSAATEKS